MMLPRPRAAGIAIPLLGGVSRRPENQNGLPTSFSDPPDAPVRAEAGELGPSSGQSGATGVYLAAVILTDGISPIGFDIAVDATDCGIKSVFVLVVFLTFASCSYFWRRLYAISWIGNPDHRKTNGRDNEGDPLCSRVSQ